MKRIFLIAAAFLAAVSLSGQTPLPDDPDVRKGQLENGLTYYIRHNAKPAQRAEFYLATNVGAIQETPDQDGLAHFLEHMCFNGTQNMPGKTMLDYLQKIGAEFGRNINAQTGVEQTSYMLNNMPVNREGIVDTCLLIMHDYSHYVTNDPVEIDKERGVIVEEWRTRRTADWRMHEKSLPYYYGDSKYGSCTLIGSKTNIETFKPASLDKFYETWYRPDLQAVIIVGDIDVDKVEAKVKALFSDIPAKENPQPKAVHKIPGNVEPVVGIITDPEASSTNLEVLWKHEPLPEELNSTDVGFMFNFIKAIASSVMQERFGDISARPDAPFLGAGFMIGDLCETCEVVMGNISCRNGEAVPSFKAFLTEVEKFKRYGVSEEEVERAKQNMLSAYEKSAEGAGSRQNADFVGEYLNNFFDNYAYMTPAAEYELAKNVCAQLNADLVNKVVIPMITDENLVVLYKAPEKEGISHPTESEFLQVIGEVREAEIQANVSKDFNKPLLDKSALKGSPVKKSKKTIYGATEWSLKNGLRVVVLPTDYKKDQVILNLYMDGGRSLIATEDLPSFDENIFGQYLANTGVASFPGTDLPKMLTGKMATAQPYLTGLRHGISAVASPKDLETAFQLMYLEFMEPRFDEDEFNTGISQLKAILPNVIGQPGYKMQEAIINTLYGNHPRVFSITDEVIAKSSLATIERVYRELYKDVSGATLVITGNVDLTTLQPLVETYAGSLPKGKKGDRWIDRDEDIVKGQVTHHFNVKMETPKNTVLQLYTAEVPYSIERSVMMSAAQYILDMIYIETLREEEGGTYGAHVSFSVDDQPEETGSIEVYFDTNPESQEKLRKSAVEGLQKLLNEGPTEKQINMTIENFKKKIPESRISNSYWMQVIKYYYDHGKDYDKEYEAAIDGITAEKVQQVVKDIVSQGNFIEIMMSPEE